MGDPSIDCLARVWRSISKLCAGLDADDWEKPTACPGWDVQDQVAHLIGPEAIFLGRPQPVAVGVPPPYVRNDLGKVNEAAIQYRRGWPSEAVLAELDEITSLRLEQLEEMTAEELDADSWTPTGPGTYRDLLAIRVLDCWVHEQDIREATERRGHLEGPVADHVLGRFFGAMPFVVGKKAEAADGSVVSFEISGPTTGTLVVGVEGGRAKVIAAPAAAAAAGSDSGPDAGGRPSARISTDFETFTRVCAGRVDPAAAEGAGALSASGDADLCEAVVRSLPFMI